MTPEMLKLLTESGNVIHTNNKHLDNLVQYLDENLCTLRHGLNEDNFQLILDIIIEQIVTLTFNLINTSLEVSG